MVDWTASMQRTYEYYVVDPGTWRDSKRVTTIKKCSISRDAEVETLGSATIDIDELIGECYLRVYLVTIQNGVRERHPLGTFLVQSPSSSFDGKVRSVSVDAYTPLLELKENQPPIGYYIPSDVNVMDRAYALVSENVRAPVVKTSSETVNYSDFIADTNDTWLSYIGDFIANQIYDRTIIEPDGTTKILHKVSKFKLGLDEMGRILFEPEQDLEALQPVWTYDDNNSSILYPSLNIEHDLYGIPNVVEVVYSNNGRYFYAAARNIDPDSPVSVEARGRKIVYRVTNPDIVGMATQTQIDEYAIQLLKALSSPSYSISYSHGYCPVRLGDCVRLNYSRAGLTGIKAKVISQTIDCTPECKVTEKAIFTVKLLSENKNSIELINKDTGVM